MSDWSSPRRDFLKLGSAAALIAVTGLPYLARASTLTGTGSAVNESGRKWHELNIIGDDFMDGNVLRALEAVWHGMGDIGECLDTANRVTPGDVDSWYAEWFSTAQRLRAIADKSQAAGHSVSAAEAYLRASNYYRSAEFFKHDNPAARLSVECFQRAIPLLPIPAEVVAIPYDGTTLPGYFYRSPHATSKAPVLIVHSGFDGTPEEMKFIAEGAVKRGYHALLFSGPGQGMAIREQNLPFRADWERVITPVVDYVVELDGVDPDRLALLGSSFGGYLAPRAVAFEHRIKACVANPGVLNWYDAAVGFQGPEVRDMIENQPEVFNKMIFEQMKHSTGLQWSVNDGLLKYAAKTPADIFSALKAYNNEPYVSQIKCSMLVMDGTEETVSEGQAQKLYDALRCPKDYMLFDETSTGALHCQTGALAISNQRMFDWLDGHLS